MKKTLYILYSCFAILLLKRVIMIGKSFFEAGFIISIVLWLGIVICLLVLLLKKGTFAERMKRLLLPLVITALYLGGGKLLDSLIVKTHFALKKQQYEAFAGEVIRAGDSIAATLPPYDLQVYSETDNNSRLAQKAKKLNLFRFKLTGEYPNHKATLYIIESVYTGTTYINYAPHGVPADEKNEMKKLDEHWHFKSIREGVGGFY